MTELELRGEVWVNPDNGYAPDLSRYLTKENQMTDTTTIHYDIRAVSGVTRAACGLDNRLNHDPLTPAPFQCTTNRNVVTCKECRHKIDLLADFGGDAIMLQQDVDNRRWFIEAMKLAADEWNADNPVDDFEIIKKAVSESLRENGAPGAVQDRILNMKFDNAAFTTTIKNAMRDATDEDNEENDDEYKSWHRDIIMLTLQEYHNAYSLSQRKMLKEAVAEAAAEGTFKFNTEELADVVRAQMHRVLNGRIQQDVTLAVQRDRQNARNANSIELTRVINNAFNKKLAEASYLIGRDFMDSPKVKQLLADQAKIGAELNFEDSKEDLVDLMRSTIEGVLETTRPVQFTQYVTAPEALSASEIYRQNKGLLVNEEIKTKPFVVNFDRLNHQMLGEWAVANDLVRQWSYDTNMVRSMLKMRQDDGNLIHPGEDEPRR